MHLVLFEKALDALGEPDNGFVLLRHHLADVHVHAVHRDAVVRRVILHLAVQVAGVQQRLCARPATARRQLENHKKHILLLRLQLYDPLDGLPTNVTIMSPAHAAKPARAAARMSSGFGLRQESHSWDGL